MNCRKCKEEFTPLEKNLKTSRGVTCKKCSNLALKLRRRKAEMLKDIHYVYYIPSNNYCGITNDPDRRLYRHRLNGIDTDGARMLYSSKSRKEALYHEALFQSVLCMEGIHEGGARYSKETK